MRYHFILAEFFDAYDKLTPTRVDGGKLDLSYANITSLGNLTHVRGIGGDLNIYGTNITSLGKLKHVVDGYIWCNKGEQYNKLQAENDGRFRIKVWL